MDGTDSRLPAARRESVWSVWSKTAHSRSSACRPDSKGPIEIVDHHLFARGRRPYYFSGFDEAAILTVDGVGDWPPHPTDGEKDSRIERFEQVDFPDSLGFFYSAITGYLGFEVNEGEYKVMGHVDQLISVDI